MADINTPSATPADERQQATESLYVSNFDYIRELVYSDPRMTLESEQQISEGIAKHLPSYEGAPNDSAFRQWVTGIIIPLVGFHAIKCVCEPFVHAAIWRALGHSSEPSKYDDYPELVREIEQEVWLWVFMRQDDLRKPGLARITTRVYQRTHVMTRDWLKRQRTRRAAVIRRLYDLPSKAQAKRVAAALDNEAARVAAEQAEAKEIQLEMKKVEMAA